MTTGKKLNNKLYTSNDVAFLMLTNHSLCTTPPIGAGLKNDSFTYSFCVTPQTSKYTNLVILGAWGSAHCSKGFNSKDWMKVSFFLVLPNPGIKLTSETSSSWRVLSKESLSISAHWGFPKAQTGSKYAFCSFLLSWIMNNEHAEAKSLMDDRKREDNQLD